MNPTLNRNVLVSEGLKSIYLEHHSAVLTDTGEIMTASYESPAVELITDIMQREYVTLGFDVLPERKVKMYEPSLISSLLKEVAQRKTDEKSASDAKSETYGIAMRMLEYAAQHECSDIHIELYKTETRIEMRIDGRMVVYGQIIKDYEWGQHLIAILFYHADIKDDDFNVTKPNNGRITALLKTAQGKRDTDWRMSYMPALNKGGQATLRWLNKSMEIPTLEELGWEAGQRREVRNFMYSKAGVLVFAGQTGSGKTTSIAAMLNEVKRKGRSINTLEDPVEFDLGVIQTSINSQGEGKALTTKVGVQCPTCQKGELRRLKGKKGHFWACNRYPDCKSVFPDNKGKPNLNPAPKQKVKPSETELCKCGKGLVRRSGKKEGSFWWGCSGFPKCKVRYFDKNGHPDRDASELS
ncbi:ATPase, T2SS/T4P/T4SS family [Vibrio tapetis]|uniref:Uncharacterized protein n=1 Tax=Vibrio tapetis subsp. tapetis TaxID=1671868 RepID=A0A2N8ZHX3_9VIBR|nr:ATPase, T2SS/T4P/T4SS family [Vibrio tapetis]SON51513.1 protein of unknown function [Vibrio tapetis subsp. tapetis]